jgi:uncharacterized protein YndB with AHSA1/START domain
MGEGRRLEKEVVVNATPDQVWEAISTGPGISAWFVPHEIDPETGEAGADFGGGNTQGGRVLAWEPGKRLVFGGPESESEERADFSLEFLIEGREGGATVLRLVQSGFFEGDDWEAEFENFSTGWDLYFHNLAEYFNHFAGLPVVNVVTSSFTSLDGDAVWARFHRELGLHPSTAVGDRVHLTPAGTEAIMGVVDVRSRGVLGVRTAHGFYRFLGVGADAHCTVNTAHYFYGVDLDRAERTAIWQAWLDRLFHDSQKGSDTDDQDRSDQCFR